MLLTNHVNVLFLPKKSFLASSMFSNLNLTFMLSSTVFIKSMWQNIFYSFIHLREPINLIIPIDLFSLKIVSLLLPLFLQMKMYDILGFLNFLYLLHLIQKICFIYIYNTFINTFFICNQSIFFSFNYQFIENIKTLYHFLLTVRRKQN